MKQPFLYTKLETSEDEYRHCYEGEQSKILNDGFSMKRNVSLLSGITLVIGNVIGSGIFIVPSGVLETAGNNAFGCLLAWFLAGLLTMFVALCFCELATLMPKSGGILNYLHEIFGDGICFIACWMLFFTAFPQGGAVQTIALG